MAISDDFSVAVNGDIRYTGTTANYTVLALHRWLQDLADQAAATGNDLVDITSPTPSVRSTDQIIALQGNYNIDDAAAEHLYGGSISQYDGDTLYGGLRVLGSVNTAATQIQVIQDGGLYDTDSPFWGTQTTPYNGGGSVLFRCLIKCRENGHDIDGKRIRVRCGHMDANGGDTFSAFDVTLGLAEAVAAVSTVDDPQNTTALATIAAWAGGDIPTNTEGYQTIDINDGNGAQPYYSQWTFNTNSAGMKALWEWAKYITRVGSSESPYGLDGDVFQGITHEISYDGQSGTFQEDEYVVWGTDITYDNLTGGTFTRGNYVVFSGGAAGKVLYDNGTTQMKIALETVPSTITNDETITEYSPGGHGTAGTASGVTAAVNVTVTNADKNGGEGWVLAYNDTTDDLWVQIMSGAAVEDNVPIRGITSGATGSAAGDAVARTIPSVFIGSYTGSIIGAFGVGIDPDDLASGDTVRDLTNTVRNAPNNVTFTISNLVSGEHYLLVMKKHAANPDFDFEEMTLATALTGATETIVDVGTGNIPADAPQTGVLRVTLDDGRVRRVPYTSHDGDDEFTIASSDWQDPDDAGIGNGVSLAFIDKLAASSSEAFTLKYNADRTLWLRARDGGATPLVTWEQQGNLTNVGGSAIAGQISDA